jgi:hypothetical protein
MIKKRVNEGRTRAKEGNERKRGKEAEAYACP